MSEPWKVIEAEDKRVSLWLDAEGTPVLNDPSPDDGASGEIKNPRLKELSDENARHRVKNKELTTENQRLRIERAFLLAAASAGVGDVDAALRLADIGAVTVAEDGTLTGVDELVGNVVDRYPHLLRTPEPERVQPEKPLTPSGAPMNSGRKPPTGLDRAALEKKFPSLRRPWARR